MFSVLLSCTQCLTTMLLMGRLAHVLKATEVSSFLQINNDCRVPKKITTENLLEDWFVVSPAWCRQVDVLALLEPCMLKIRRALINVEASVFKSRERHAAERGGGGLIQEFKELVVSSLKIESTHKESCPNPQSTSARDRLCCYILKTNKNVF